MPVGGFDRLARDLESSQGRRASLKVLGLAAVAAALTPATAGGKSKCKKKVDNAVATCQAAADARCQSQVTACTTAFTTSCRGEDCAGFVACCPSLGTCDANAFFTCVLQLSNQQD